MSNDAPVQPHQLLVVVDFHTESLAKRRRISGDVKPAVRTQVINTLLRPGFTSHTQGRYVYSAKD